MWCRTVSRRGWREGPPGPDYAGSVLQVRGVSHAFAERPVLDDVTFDVTSGVLTGLLGPNGAGKTTLMRISSGCSTPTPARPGGRAIR